MHIQDHILSNLPVLGLKDSMKEVLKFFRETTYSHVGIKDNDRFLGVIGQNDLSSINGDKSIDDYRYNLESFYALSNTTWLEVLEIFAKNDANLVPLLNDDHQIIGYYHLGDILDAFTSIPFFTNPGSILVVAKGPTDYSFSEITQIVESNNGKLHGVFITDSRSDIVQITLKIEANNLSDIIHTFRRYNYNILYGNDNDEFLEDLKKRSDYLDKYLNV